MPLTVSEFSSRCRLDGEFFKCEASSDRSHHLSGERSVSARSSWRTAGKSAAKTGDLRILRRYLRRQRNLSMGPLLAALDGAKALCGLNYGANSFEQVGSATSLRLFAGAGSSSALS